MWQLGSWSGLVMNTRSLPPISYARCDHTSPPDSNEEWAERGKWDCLAYFNLYKM